MGFRYYNPNPANQIVGDCAIRAISKLENLSWDDAFLDLTAQAFIMKNLQNGNAVLGAYLYSKGYRRYSLPTFCPYCYTIRDFANEFRYGKYAVGTGTHVVAVVDGNYYDNMDSGNEIVAYCYKKES